MHLFEAPQQECGEEEEEEEEEGEEEVEREGKNFNKLLLNIN